MAGNKKIDKFSRFIPKLYKPGINPVVTALIEAMADSDETLSTQVENTKNQLFVRTAEGQYLDRLGAGLGVARPPTLGLFDEDFQNLIPNLSLKAKQIRQIFYDTMDVFWGPTFSRVNLETINSAPFNLVAGDRIEISVDGGEIQDIPVLLGDVAIPGAATAQELANILARIDGTNISIIEDVVTGNESVNIRTNSVGPRGSLQVYPSTGIGALKVNLPTGKRFRITDLQQRTAVYEINSRELLIELPAIIPALRRTLKGSHHIHADATLESPDPTSGKIWEGSFLYGPSTTPYNVTAANATLQQTIEAGQVYTAIQVSGAVDIKNEQGFLIFDWGRGGKEEQPVGYIGRPNENTILLDPSYKFSKDHVAGANIHVLQPDLEPAIPRIDGTDLAIYLTSPAGARAAVEELLRTLAAAGIIVNFVVLLPDYKYLCKNPYAE